MEHIQNLHFLVLIIGTWGRMEQHEEEIGMLAALKKSYYLNESTEFIVKCINLVGLKNNVSQKRDNQGSLIKYNGL